MSRRTEYKEGSRKELWNYWVRLGREVWTKNKEKSYPNYPKDSYAYWYAEAIRDKMWRWQSDNLDLLAYERELERMTNLHHRETAKWKETQKRIMER